MEKLACISLTHEILKKLTKSSDSFKRDRAKILLLSSENEPSKQIDEQKVKMLKAASTELIKLGLHFTTWNLSKLRDYYPKESIVQFISLESVRRLLKSEF